MNPSSYYYLAVIAVAAVALLAYIAKRMPCLLEHTKKNTRLELGVLCGVLLLGSLAIYGSFLLETNYYCYLDSGTDTVEQYVPFYLDLLDKVANGSFGNWNFNFGVGLSTLSYQSWVLDPFNLLLIPAGLLLGSQHLSLILAGIQIVKIILCGVLFDRILLSFCKTPLARIVGASLYAFCGFLSLWGQHYWLGTMPVLFTAILLASELLLKEWTKPRFAAVVALSAISMGWSPYGGFMILLGLALIELLLIIGRASSAHAVKETFKAIGTLAAPVLCGCLAAGVTLIPYAQFLFGETGRVSGGQQVSTASKAVMYATEFVPLRWIPMILSRLLGNSLVSSGDDIPLDLVPATESFPYVNCYELLMLGFSALALMLLLQFFHWVVTDASKKTKVLVGIGTLLVLLYCFNNFFPALFNVFAEPKYRSGFVLSVPICMALAIGWEQRIQNGKPSKAMLAVGGLLTLAIIVWSLVNTVNGRWICVTYLAALFAFMGVLAVLMSKAKTQPEKPAAQAHPLLVALLAFIMIGSTVADGFFTANNRITANKDSFPEATWPNVSSDTLAVLDQISASDPDFYRVEKMYVDWMRPNDSFIEGYASVSAYNSTNDADILEFYRAVWPDMIATAPYVQVYMNDPDVNAINDLLGIRYLLSKELLAMQSFTLVGQSNGIYIYKNEGACVLSGHTNVMSETDFYSLDLQGRRNALETCVVVPDSVAASRTNSAQDQKMTVNSVRFGKSQADIVADVEAPAATMACLSAVHTNGWRVFIDGQEVETFRADIGFVGFEIPAGTHQIEARYTPAGQSLGLVLTAAGLALAVLLCLVFSRIKKKSITSSEGAPR